MIVVGVVFAVTCISLICFGIRGVRLQERYYWYILYELYKCNFALTILELSYIIGLSYLKTVIVLEKLKTERVVVVSGDMISLSDIGRKIFDDNKEALRAAGWQAQLNELSM